MPGPRWRPDRPAGAAALGIGGFGPTLAALVLRLAGRRGARQARLPAAGRWAPAAVLIGVTPLAVAALVAGGADAGVIAAGGGLVPFLVLQLVMVSAEEFGRRGHASPGCAERSRPSGPR